MPTPDAPVVTRRRALGSLLALPLAAATGCRFESAADKAKTTIEVAVFEGGFGIEWHKKVAREYEALHPDVRVHLWGDPRVDEKLKPRILRGDPPDMASCNLPAWKLIVADKLYALDETLKTPAYGQPEKSWRDTLTPGILKDFTYQGRAYAMPTNLGAWVCWYDRRLFRKHSLEEPKTWGGFMALCEKVKTAGLAPLAFQGKYPTYLWSTLLSVYQRLVPFEQWYRVEDLQPGAFTDRQFVRAAGLVQEMAVRYFQPGALAMTHTESQLEWVNGRAAMVFCGLWLKNEMKKALPPDFEMACFAVPPVEGGQGDPRATYAGGGENFYVFKEAKRPKEAADFLKYMTSIGPARSYTQQLDTLSPVLDSYKGVQISPALQSAVDVVEQSDRIFSDRLGILYIGFLKGALQEQLAALVAGKVTPEAFGKNVEAAASEVRRDPDIYKPPPSGA